MNTTAAVNEVTDLAHWWANKIQWNEDDHDDLVQEGMLEFIQTLNRYEATGTEIKNMSGLAGDIFARAMKWFYKPVDREGTVEQMTEATAPDSTPVEIDDLLMMMEYHDEVRHALGERAANIALDLVEPTALPAGHPWHDHFSAVVFGAEVDRQDKIRRDAEGERGPKGGRLKGRDTLVINREHIRRSSGLTESAWEQTQQQIRKVTRRFLSERLARV